jgi:hypothetical protein
LTEYFWVPLKELSKQKGTTKFNCAKYPGYVIEKYIVWGLTYKILENLLSLFSAIKEEKPK